MTQTVKVIDILPDERALVELKRQSACGGDCQSCGAGCLPMVGGTVRAVAKNSIHASKGDVVVIESSTPKILGLAALVYLLPCVLLIVFGVFGTLAFGERPGLLLGGFGFAAGLFAAFLKSRGMKKGLHLEIVARAGPQNEGTPCSDI